MCDDDTCNVFRNEYGDFKVREQQISKVRYEVLSINPNGTPRQISSMFALVENRKAALKIQEYSISQTSLEQIFNQFASTQEEEEVRPMVSNTTNSRNNTNNNRNYNQASNDDTAVEIQQATVPQVTV